MRRWLILTLTAACALAGCGSSSSSSNPVTTELSYLPQNSPLVLTLATDPNGSAIHGVNALINRFPFASLGVAALKSRLQQAEINYDGDVRPLLGNPIALAGAAPTLSARVSGEFLVVWVTKDADKLDSLIKKAVPGIHQAGTHDGATLYRADSKGAAAVDDATLVIGSSPSVVNSALDRHAHGGGVTSDQYSKAFAQLPQDAVLKAFGNLSGVLAQPSAAKARRVPWVAAIRGYAETVRANSTGLTISYHVDTTGRPLTPSQLPFAAGANPPAFAANAPITVGIHDPAQIASFIQSVTQATNPAAYSGFLARQGVLRAKTGTDLNSLIKLMTGDLIIASDTRTTIGRVTVTDPAAAKRALGKLVSAPRSVLRSNPLKKTGATYEIVQRTGPPLRVGVFGNQLVVGKAPVNQLRAVAAAPTVPASGAHGTVAFRVSLNQVLALALRQAPPQVLQTVLSRLSEITGSTSVTTSGLTGNATIGVK